MIDDSELSPDELAVIDAVGRIPAPQPPAAVLARFREQLRTEAVSAAPSHRRRWPLALAAGLVLLLGGGWYQQWRERQQVVTELRTELTAALSDLSEARRFQAIASVGQAKVGDDAIVASLTTAMLTDPNTNVRVAAVEALAQVANPNALYSASLQAVTKEESPFVLAALLSSAEQLPSASRNQLLRSLLANPHLLPGLKAQAEARMAS